MNILFLTLAHFNNLNERGIYTDLLRELLNRGHNVSVISPIEKRYAQETKYVVGDNYSILNLRIGNIQKTNIIEKGLSTLFINRLYKKAIIKYFNDVKFDIVLYSTPPITLVGTIDYVKKRDNSKTYLLLKDIFPQNAVDMGYLFKTGFLSILYNFFRAKEKKLYSISDKIGCMSNANVNYVLTHNEEVKQRNNMAILNGREPIVEVCPNSLEPIDLSLCEDEIISIRNEYHLPLNKKVFIYGGNLGKVQGIDFLVECLKQIVKIDSVYFLIVGSGTDSYKISSFINEYEPNNVGFIEMLPKNEYEKLVASADIGLIFLNDKNTIPNFPSRLLSYMQAKIPVFAITDKCTDIGNVIEKGNFGWWCESNDINTFISMIEFIFNDDIESKGINAYNYLLAHYSSNESANLIIG